ncbi:hypothetical protein Btru_059780, partial [Bulinus truncatus]
MDETHQETSNTTLIRNYSHDSTADLIVHMEESDKRKCTQFRCYAVIFLHRQRSLQPFYQRVEKNILDVLTLSDENDTEIKVSVTFAKRLAPYLKQYQTFRDKGMLCMVEFTTLADYLYLLRAACEALNVFGRNAMIYLAAAVADFYIPKGLMPEHKIQSSDGALQLSLEMTPKMLKPLVKDWVPNAFIISFKLETNHEILIEKAKKALSSYNHQVVIANLLDTRKKEVYIVTKETDERLCITDEEMMAGQEIEKTLIEKLV